MNRKEAVEFSEDLKTLSFIKNLLYGRIVKLDMKLMAFSFRNRDHIVQIQHCI
jgi:hypothetical protein